MGKVVDLPSGAKLEIGEAPFKEARALCDAVMEEAEALRVDPNAQVDVNLMKDVFLKGMTSKKIDRALVDCLKRATYNGNRIDDATFEPVEARQDFYVVRFEVALENVRPFTKSLYAQYADMLQKIQSVPA